MDFTLLLLVLLCFMGAYTIWSSQRTSKDQQSGESTDKLIKLDADISRMDPLIREEFGRNREESQRALRESREEQQMVLLNFERRLSESIRELNELQRQKFEDLILKQEHIRKNADDKLSEIRSTMEDKLKNLQDDNAKQLDEMRKTVDEKLQEGLEQRFNQSFKLISDRLEQVHKGLGEMQGLANGVGDLKKVLSNVKTRGIVGEIQLRNLLEEFLTRDQYEENVIVKQGTQERVEFVVKLPNKQQGGEDILVPIDSKFPIEVYERLIDAYNAVGTIPQKEIEAARKAFADVVKENAKTIASKYINPPVTTDFAVMFVPTEGLYAEILHLPGLFEFLRKEYQIIIVGPTNLVAYLSSLQMGFRTLAIEQRSSEVWKLLGAVKSEFGKFGTVLEATKRKLELAASEIDKAGVRTRAIEKKLRDVQELPSGQSNDLLHLPAFGELDEIDSDSSEEDSEEQR
ncbi:MAG: DNA recombination protein RmuC [Ignavibacteria bacterium]